MPNARGSTPFWFWMVAILLAVWGAAGCYACYLQFTRGADAMGPATQYDRALYASMPVWYNYCYALAVGSGLAGGIGLLLRAGWAGIAFLISLVAALVQFGYLFIASDIIAVKGVGTVLPFPLFIIAVAAMSIWFAAHAYRCGWTS